MEAALSRTANPLAASLDAGVEAHHAGVGDADVALLQEIGADIAAFAQTFAEKFNRLTTGAAGTNRSSPSGPAKHPYEMDEPDDIVGLLLQYFDGDAYGYSLDAVDVIRTAAELRLAAPLSIHRLAA
jgi:hypothetical protein